DKLVGIGIASYVEVCSVAGGWEYVEARVEPTGRIRLFTGISSHGQSTEEVLRLIFAKEMELNANDIDIVTGDTDVVAYGWGSIASRSLMAAGSGVVAVAQKLKERLLNIAATLMEANINDLAYSSGKIHVKDSPQNFMTIRDIASQIYAYHGITSKAQLVKEPLTVSEFVHIEPAFPYGTHVCMVEIDKDTGEVKILKYVAVDDVGRIISRELVEGQIIGGIVSGVGQTLLEEIIYAENCTLITDSLINYAIPSSNETPNIISDFIEVPAPNKLGVKGAGESGVVGAIAALANAIEDALSPFNVEISSLPLTPWIIWQTLKSSAFTKP
ncbi:MAG: molybdopterin cofactor-binding domain-containing protein, partial [Candidatus Caldarchaeum sp.]